MPRKPIEWSKCIIYKIWKDDDFYVGSTTDFANRKRYHKCSCNNESQKGCNLKLYQTIREKGGWIAWKMTPLEEYKECQTQVQARIREDEWRVKLNANLNMIRAYLSEELLKEQKKENGHEYREKHKEEAKEYYQINKEKIQAQKKQKFECECGGKYIKTHKNRHQHSIKHQTYLATISN